MLAAMHCADSSVSVIISNLYKSVVLIMVR